MQGGQQAATAIVDRKQDPLAGPQRPHLFVRRQARLPQVPPARCEASQQSTEIGGDTLGSGCLQVDQPHQPLLFEQQVRTPHVPQAREEPHPQ